MAIYNWDTISLLGKIRIRFDQIATLFHTEGLG